MVMVMVMVIVIVIVIIIIIIIIIYIFIIYPLENEKNTKCYYLFSFIVASHFCIITFTKNMYTYFHVEYLSLIV